MKKALLALSLGSLSTVSMAEVVLYGQIRAGYEAISRNTDDVTVNGKTVAAGHDGPANNGVVDRVSRIGIKGQEDLSNGLKAIWQVEQNVPITGGTAATWATRDSFIGLQGDFGTLKAGRLSNYSNDPNHGFKGDPWIYNKSVSNTALGLHMLTRTDARYIGVGYDSPEWSGFSFGLLASPRDNNNNGDRSSENGTHAKYSAGASYRQAGFQVKYAFDYLKNNAGYDLDGQSHHVEGVYDANNWFAALVYQYSKNIKSYSELVQTYGKAVSGHELAVSLGYHFGNVFPKISYAHGWDVKLTTDDTVTDGVGNAYTFQKGDKVGNTQYDQVVVGMDYGFSKRTIANLSAGWLRAGNARATSTQGLIYDGGRTTIKAVGLGLRHFF